MGRLNLVLHQRADFFTDDGLADRVLVVEVEHEDGDIVVQAEGERGRVHDVQALFEGLDERQGVVFDGVGIFLRILVVDAVDEGSFQRNGNSRIYPSGVDLLTTVGGEFDDRNLYDSVSRHIRACSFQVKKCNGVFNVKLHEFEIWLSMVRDLGCHSCPNSSKASWYGKSPETGENLLKLHFL